MTQDTDVWALVDKTGLDSTTIFDLLAKGWKYVEQIGEASVWTGPMTQLVGRELRHKSRIPGETYGQAIVRLRNAGNSESWIAAYLGVSVESLRAIAAGL